MDSKNVVVWGQISVSILSLTIFVVTLVVALRLGNENMLLMLVGAAIAMANTVVAYWLGSSSGSAKKDDVIAAQSAPPAHRPPATDA